jgi:hypothetical protein
MQCNEMMRTWIIAGVTTASAVLAASAQAAYVKTYDANSAGTAPDPTSAGGGSWTLAGVSAATVANGPGSDAGGKFWNVTDTNTNVSVDPPVAQNNSVNYILSGGTVAAPGDSAVIGALTDPNGWYFTAKLRVNQSASPTAPPAYTAPTWFDIRNGSRAFVFGFVNDGTDNEGIYAAPAASGAFDASLATNQVKLMQLDDAFHTVTLAYNTAGSGSLDVYVDGNLEKTFASTFFGGSTTYRAQWGSAASSATQNVDWQFVEFGSPVPEPSAVAAGALGLTVLAARRRRTRG